MKVVVDSHVHLRPSHPPEAWLDAASSALRAAAPDAEVRMLCLTESAGYDVWSALNTQGSAGAWSLKASPEKACVQLTHSQRGALWLFAGRQVISAERLEVLALLTDACPADGEKAEAVIDEILAVGGLPVLPWSPGKWLGSRGRALHTLLQQYTVDQLLIGDISLRPLGWPEPGPMRRSRAHGFKVIAGSDPMPPSPELDHVGEYASLADFDFDPEAPVTSLRCALRDPCVPFETVGARNTPWGSATRYARNLKPRLS